MRNLVLIRHAQAGFESETGRDLDRALSPAGVDEAHAQGAWLARNAFAPDRVLCSPARRTRETAAALGLTVTHEIEAIYEASAGELVALIEPHRDVDVLALVGHNPGISGLAGFLAGKAVMLSPGTIVSLRWEAPVPAPLPLGTAELRAYRHAPHRD